MVTPVITKCVMCNTITCWLDVCVVVAPPPPPSPPPAGLLLCGFLGAQQLLPGSCNFELGTCGYTSDAEHGSWSVNEEGTVSYGRK